jgi:outer membrane lipoprotein-sorting protein
MENRLIHADAARHDTNQRATKQAGKIFFSLAFVLSATAWNVAAEPLPSAREILATARLQQAQQQIDLQGQLRQEAMVVPFRLTQTGSIIKYSFANPPEALQLRLGENDSRLEQLSQSGTEKITPAQFDRKVRGTAVTYEDLALKFLYWPDARVLGEEPVRSRRCWKLELQPPSRESQYSSVTLWVDKNSGALMEMEGFDWNGRLAKRFEVISAQKIDGRWFLKQMRIEELQPSTGKVQSRAYLEIKK